MGHSACSFGDLDIQAIYIESWVNHLEDHPI